MKRKIILLSIAVACLVAILCGCAQQEENKIVGIWQCQNQTSGGFTIDYTPTEDFDGMFYIFEEDGTARMKSDMFGVICDDEGTWTEEDGQTIVRINMMEDVVTINEDGNAMTMTSATDSSSKKECIRIAEKDFKDPTI